MTANAGAARHPLRRESITPVREQQPGGRRAAPGDLSLVQAFVNTHWNIEQATAERLVTPSALARWLVDHGLLKRQSRLNQMELQRALDVREGLRALLFTNNGLTADRERVKRLNASLASPALFVQFDRQGRSHFVGTQPDFNAAMATLATIVVGAQFDGSWRRLKACPGAHCGWAFYDHSRNQGSHWCAMSLCGGRAKARDYRHRRRLALGE